MGQKHGAGKGSVYRPVDQTKYDENWRRIFGMKTFSEYHDEAVKTRRDPGWAPPLVAWALAVNGEAGELAEHVKKFYRDGVEVPVVQEAIKKEVGDILWYLDAVAEAAGFTLADAAAANIDKLRSRAERGVIHGAGDNR